MSVSIRWNDKAQVWHVVTSTRLPCWLIQVRVYDIGELTRKGNAIMNEIAEILK